jgi:hypothetical protein
MKLFAAGSRPAATTLFAAGPRLSRRRFVYLLAAIAAALGVTIGLTVTLAVGAAAGTIPSGARVVTVTPVFGQDPDVSRHRLDHAFTITDPARVARIAAILDGLAPFPIGELSCARGNGAAMQLTFRTRPGGPVLATVVATYTGCSRVWNTGAPDTRYLEDYTSSGQQVQQLVLAIAGVRWPYTPDVLPPLHP